MIIRIDRLPSGEIARESDSSCSRETTWTGRTPRLATIGRTATTKEKEENDSLFYLGQPEESRDRLRLVLAGSSWQRKTNFSRRSAAPEEIAADPSLLFRSPRSPCYFPSRGQDGDSCCECDERLPWNEPLKWHPPRSAVRHPDAVR